MRSTAWAFGWQLWGRHRWLAVGLALYLAALALAARAPWAMSYRPTLFMSTVPAGFALVFLLAMFTYPEGDVAGSASAFPSTMLRLPVRTWELAFWPALHGSAAAALAWIAVAAGVLRPLGVEAPLGWPAALVGAMLAGLQALLWWPLGLPGLRIVLALTCVPGLAVGAIAAGSAGVSEPVVTAVLGAAALALHAASVAGLARARCGEAPDWQWLPARRAMPMSACRLPRLVSPLAAQVWFEWRAGGKSLPLGTAVLCSLLTLPLLWIRDVTPIQPNPPHSGFGSLEINLWLQMIRAALLTPVVLAAILGCGRRAYDSRRGDFTLHPFLATRPVPPATFAAARFLAAGLSTVAAWGIMLAFAFGWLLVPARDGAATAPLLALLPRYATPTTPLSVSVFLALLVFWTWKNQVQGLYADLSGRPWLVYGAPLLHHALVLNAYVLLVQAAMDRATDPSAAVLPSWLLGPLAAGLGARVIAAAWSLRRLRRSGVSAGRLALAVLAWAGTVAAVAAGLAWLGPGDYSARPVEGQLVLIYALWWTGPLPAELRQGEFFLVLAVLFVPLTRLLAAPLALEWNRQR